MFIPVRGREVSKVESRMNSVFIIAQLIGMEYVCEALFPLHHAGGNSVKCPYPTLLRAGDLRPLIPQYLTVDWSGLVPCLKWRRAGEKKERKGRKKIIRQKGLIDTSQVHAHLASVAYVLFAHVGTGQDSNCPLGILQVNHTIYQLVLCLLFMVDVNYFSGSAVLRKTAENERCVEVLNGRAMQGSNHVLLCGGAEGLVMILRQVSIVRVGMDG